MKTLPFALKLSLFLRYGFKKHFTQYSKPILYCDDRNQHICFKHKNRYDIWAEDFSMVKNIQLHARTVRYVDGMKPKWRSCDLCSCSDKLTKIPMNYDIVSKT